MRGNVGGYGQVGGFGMSSPTPPRQLGSVRPSPSPAVAVHERRVRFNLPVMSGRHMSYASAITFGALICCHHRSPCHRQRYYVYVLPEHTNAGSPRHAANGSPPPRTRHCRRHSSMASGHSMPVAYHTVTSHGCLPNILRMNHHLAEGGERWCCLLYWQRAASIQ